MQDNLFFALEALCYNTHGDTRELYCAGQDAYGTIRDLEGQYRAHRYEQRVGLPTVTALVEHGYLYPARTYPIPARPDATNTVYRVSPSGRAAYTADVEWRIAWHAMTGD